MNNQQTLFGPPKIDHFHDNYRWLSNFYPAVVWLDGYDYPTVEHAYQMAKTTNFDSRMYGRRLKEPGWVKKFGRVVTMRPDWEQVKQDVMYELVTQKFMDPELGEMLRATGDAELIEENTWNDRYWGTCKGVGENHLGKILMRVRAEL